MWSDWKNLCVRVCEMHCVTFCTNLMIALIVCRGQLTSWLCCYPVMQLLAETTKTKHVHAGSEPKPRLFDETKLQRF